MGIRIKIALLLSKSTIRPNFWRFIWRNIQTFLTAWIGMHLSWKTILHLHCFAVCAAYCQTKKTGEWWKILFENNTTHCKTSILHVVLFFLGFTSSGYFMHWALQTCIWCTGSKFKDLYWAADVGAFYSEQPTPPTQPATQPPLPTPHTSNTQELDWQVNWSGLFSAPHRRWSEKCLCFLEHNIPTGDFLLKIHIWNWKNKIDHLKKICHSYKSSEHESKLASRSK